MLDGIGAVSTHAFQVWLGPDERELGWPHLWLSNAEANGASGRIKEKQGAKLVGYEPASFVSGDGSRMVWLLAREDWLSRRTSSHAHPDRERPARS